MGCALAEYGLQRDSATERNNARLVLRDSGVYFSRLTVDGMRDVRKMILLR